jgi:hypothetical protein
VNFINKLKSIFTRKTAFVAAAGAAAVPALTATPSHAALGAEATAMVTAAIAAFTDMATAVASLATANMGVAIAIVVSSLIIAYVFKAGRS